MRLTLLALCLLVPFLVGAMINPFWLFVASAFLDALAEQIASSPAGWALWIGAVLACAWGVFELLERRPLRGTTALALAASGFGLLFALGERA